MIKFDGVTVAGLLKAAASPSATTEDLFSVGESLTLIACARDGATAQDAVDRYRRIDRDVIARALLHHWDQFRSIR